MYKKLKVLFISRELIAADLAYQLKKEGCDVKLYIESKNYKNCLDGMVNKVDDWKDELEWVGKTGLIVFDDVGYGKIQDDLKKRGYLVIGGGKEGDRMEIKREYGQDVMQSSGIKFGDEFETKTFDVNSALDFVKKHKGKWALKKNNHNELLTYIGDREDGTDMISILENYKSNFGNLYSYSLQKKVCGVEIAIGRFFNGNDWIGPIVYNREHKHFCNDNIGPLGGETGTLMWYDKDENSKLFRETLAKIKLHLQKNSYTGYVDINCIVTSKDNVYPLEITSRFGSSTNELQSEMQESPWGEFLLAMAKGEKYDLKYKKGYGIAVALTVPPFPYITSDKKLSQKGSGIFFGKELSEEDFSHIHFEEVQFGKKNRRQAYSVAGDTGYILYITGEGKTVEDARKKVYSLIDSIIIPKMFYRTDIGIKFMAEDYKLLKKWGWV